MQCTSKLIGSCGGFEEKNERIEETPSPLFAKRPEARQALFDAAPSRREGENEMLFFGHLNIHA